MALISSSVTFIVSGLTGRSDQPSAESLLGGPTFIEHELYSVTTVLWNYFSMLAKFLNRVVNVFWILKTSVMCNNNFKNKTWNKQLSIGGYVKSLSYDSPCGFPLKNLFGSTAVQMKCANTMSCLCVITSPASENSCHDL